MRNLFCAITEDAFLRVQMVKGKETQANIYEGETKLSDIETNELAAQARAIKSFTLFRKLMDSMRWTASEMMFQKSKNEQDMMFGKAVLYTLEVLERKIDNIGRISK